MRRDMKRLLRKERRAMWRSIKKYDRPTWEQFNTELNKQEDKL